ncbi:sphingosine kinase [Brachybacterium endophyticum]|uniref:Sphingosine kinase n=1 Tax=Brachybacterium endophyticum TaxID=2182385 RepID=A0A2U2RII5_9MICO|nr:diacylglycerol kinase family protein [Brachybacterium endophyticum]PWH05689.1 sphingosine kinase [Brachybacterium endophyticum]
MSRLRIGLLTNPSAASGAAQRTGRQVAHLLRIAGISVVELTAVSAAVARARAMEVRDTLTALVVVGGDGTVSLGAGIVAETPVRLGVVPAGSGNDFARALGMEEADVEGSVRRLLQALSRPVVAIDAIELRSGVDGDPTGIDRSIALGNVSLGFDALVNARANDSRLSPRMRYTGALVREISAFRSRRYWIEVDGGPREDIDASLLTLCNTGVLGGGMRLVPDARVDDGRLDLAVVAGLSRTGLLRLFPRVFRGTHTDLSVFSTRPVHQIRVGLHESTLLRAYADGEARNQLPVRARVLPGAVRILADLPAAADTRGNT